MAAPRACRWRTRTSSARPRSVASARIAGTDRGARGPARTRPPPFDPYRAELCWRTLNPCHACRADRRHAASHAAAFALLLILLSVPVREALLAAAPPLSGMLARWPHALAALAWSALTLHQVRALQALQARDAQHWLVAQPVALRVVARR